MLETPVINFARNTFGKISREPKDKRMGKVGDKVYVTPTVFCNLDNGTSWITYYVPFDCIFLTPIKVEIKEIE